jgi:hypothetical protein
MLAFISGFSTKSRFIKPLIIAQVKKVHLRSSNISRTTLPLQTEGIGTGGTC